VGPEESQSPVIGQAGKTSHHQTWGKDAAGATRPEGEGSRNNFAKSRQPDDSKTRGVRPFNCSSNRGVTLPKNNGKEKPDKADNTTSNAGTNPCRQGNLACPPMNVIDHTAE